MVMMIIFCQSWTCQSFIALQNIGIPWLFCCSVYRRGKTKSYLVIISDPINWTETNIEDWLDSVQKRFDILPGLDWSGCLPTSGSDLCSLSQADWVRLAGSEAGVLLYKYLVCLREPFTGAKFVEPSLPLPSYLPRTKRPSSSASSSSASSCSTSSLPLSALSPAASLSSSNSVLSGKIWADTELILSSQNLKQKLSDRIVNL